MHASSENRPKRKYSKPYNMYKLCTMNCDAGFQISNEAMRVATRSRRRDRVPITELIQRTGIQSVNRMSAEDKLRLAWQATHHPKSPLNSAICRPSKNKSEIILRSSTRGDLQAEARTILGQRNFPEPAIRIWNTATANIREATSSYSAKSAIRKFVSALPL